MIKKILEVSPFIMKRRYLLFLIPFLLIPSFSQATCKPEEAYVKTPKEDTSGNIYVSEGTALVVADGTTVVVNEVVHTAKDAKPHKTKLPKKKIEKLKLVKKETGIVKSHSSLQSTETMSSKDSRRIVGSDNPNAKQACIMSNGSSSKSLAIATAYNNILISFLLSLLIVLIFFYNRHFIKALLVGSNFQRPPPFCQ